MPNAAQQLPRAWLVLDKRKKVSAFLSLWIANLVRNELGVFS